MQQTYKRISELSNVDDPIIICEDHRFLVAEQMRNIGVKPKAIILENETCYSHLCDFKRL